MLIERTSGVLVGRTDGAELKCGRIIFVKEKRAAAQYLFVVVGEVGLIGVLALDT